MIRKRWRSTPAQPRTGGGADPEPARAPAPARCAARGRRPGRSRREPRLEHPVELDAVGGEDVGERLAIGVGEPADLVEDERARAGRAAEQAAAEARALLVGPVDQRQCSGRQRARPGPGAQHADARPSRRRRRRASRRRAPSRCASRAPAPEPSDRPAGRPRGCPPRRARARRPISASSSPRNSRAVAPLLGPSRAVAPRPARRCGRSSSRRSAITRPASIAGPAISPPVAVQRLPEAVRAAAAQGEHLEVGGEQLEARAASIFSFSDARPGAREHPLAAERDRVDAQRPGVLRRDLEDLEALLAEASARARPRGTRCRRRRASRRRTAISTSMWTKTPGDRLDPGLPALGLEPAAELLAPWRTRCATRRCRSPRVPGSTIITSPPSIAPAVAIFQIGIPASS